MNHLAPVDLMAERYTGARQRAMLTITAAANRIGVSKSTLAGWEAGSRTPRAADLFAMAKLYKCSADYLLGIQDDPVSLPVGKPLIDQETVDRILQAKTPQDLEKLVDWAPQMIWFWCTLGPTARAATPRQIQALTVELADHVRKVAPELWLAFEGASRWLRKEERDGPWTNDQTATGNSE